MQLAAVNYSSWRGCNRPGGISIQDGKRKKTYEDRIPSRVRSVTRHEGLLPKLLGMLTQIDLEREDAPLTLARSGKAGDGAPKQSANF